MVILNKNYAWYRPYHYGKYVIKNIKFYNENGVVIETNNGWLENNKKDLDYIGLNIDDIQLKRKEDFSLKGAFMISKGKDYSDELGAELYINVELVNLHFTEYKKEYDSIRKYYKGIDFDNQEFEVAENVKWLKGDYYKYSSILEDKVKNFNARTYDLDEEILNDFIKDIKKYGKKLLKEKEKIENYSVEDYIKEMESEEK